MESDFNTNRQDFAYHLCIILDSSSDVARKLLAARTLHGSEFRDSLPESALPKLISAINQELDSDLRVEIIFLMLLHWPVNELVISEVRKSVARGEYRVLEYLISDSLQSNGLLETKEYSEIIGGIPLRLDDSHSTEKEVLRLLHSALQYFQLRLKQGKLEDFVEGYLDFSNSLLTGRITHSDISKSGALKGWDIYKWRDSLLHVQEQYKSSDAIKSVTAKLGVCFGIMITQDQIEAIRRNSERARNRIFDPKDTSLLTPTDKQILATQCKEKGITPTSLMEELLDEGKRYLFVEGDYTSWPLLANMICSLAQSGHLQGIAINMPPSRQDEFKSAIEAGDLSNFHGMFSKYDKDFWNEAQKSLQQIALQTDLTWHYMQGKFHQYLQPYNELEIDEQTKLFSELEGNILVINLPPWTFHNTMKCDAKYVEGDVDPSIAKKLAEELGTHAIGSIKIMETYQTLDGQNDSKDSLGNFCEEYGISRSFAVRTTDTLLQELPYSEDYAGVLNREALDGFIMNIGSDDGGESNIDDPSPSPSNKISSPTRKPMLIH